jgi:hypothetical protein
VSAREGPELSAGWLRLIGEDLLNSPPFRSLTLKRLAFVITILATAAVAHPAKAGELKILQPADRTVVRGEVEFKVQPVFGPREQFLENPYIHVRDEAGKELLEVRAPKNVQTGICSATVDTTRFPDGQYQVTIAYRTFAGNRAVEVKEDLVLGVRNSTIRPAKMAVDFSDKAYRTDEAADFKVKVLDSRGKPMAGTRVTFKTDKGDLTSDADITDSDGEATVSLQSEELQTMTVTITVEGLPPVTKTVRFAQ